MWRRKDMSMRIDTNNIHLHDDQIHDLLTHYAVNGRSDDYKELYLELYPKAPPQEVGRCYYFSRFALGIKPDPMY